MRMLVVCMYDLIEFKNPRFSPSGSRKREAGVFKNLHFGRRIWKPGFPVPENGVFVWTEGWDGQKKYQFPEMSGYVWMEPKIRDIAGKKRE